MSSTNPDQAGFDPGFAQSVLEGLLSMSKRLSSRYFYDDRGDRLFQKIMACPEYYLTDCELEIFREQGGAIARELLRGGPCEIIELGSGDGRKVAYLLDALHQQSSDWIFRPVDISSHSLELLAANLLPGRPWLQLDPIHGNYMDVLAALEPEKVRRVFMFLGSNLGNFGVEGSVDFLRLVRSALGRNDALLIGLDLKKDPEIIRAAYNDAGGHTREFNLNLLERINRELGGNFDLAGFEHRPEYDPSTGAARSFLVSSRDQSVHIAALDRKFDFAEGEAIFMEVSQKFDADIISALCGEAGFRPDVAFNDRRAWFTDQVWRPVAVGGTDASDDSP